MTSCCIHGWVVRQHACEPRRLPRSAVLLAVAALATPATAQLPPDPIPQSIWGPNSTVQAATRIGDTLAVGGYFDYVGPPTGSLAVLDAKSGTLVGSPGLALTNADEILPAADGGWYVASDRNYRQGYVLRLTAEGVAAPGFASATANGQIYTLASHAGRLFIGGDFTSVDGQMRSGLAALDLATGALLPWSVSLGGTTPAVGAVAIANDVLYLGGAFTAAGGAPRQGLAAIDLTTDTVTPFAEAVTAGLSSAKRLSVTSTRVYIAGGCVVPGQQFGASLCAHDRTTGQRLTWAPTLKSGLTVLDVAADESAVIAALGQFGALDPGGVAAFGTADASERWYQATTGEVRTIHRAGNEVFVAGNFRHIGGVDSRRLAALDATTGAVRPWAHAGASVGAIATNGARVLVGGSILNSAGGVPRDFVALLSLTTGRPLAVRPPVEFSVRAMVALGSMLVVGGDRLSLQSARRLAAFSVTTGEDIPLGDLQPNGAVSGLVSDGRRLFLGGEFTAIGGEPRQYLAAIDVSSGRLLPWNPRPDSWVGKLRLSSGAVYAIGPFRSLPGYGRNGIAAFDTESGAVLPFNVVSDGGISDVVFWRDRVLVGGLFTRVEGQPRSGLVWVDRISGTALPLASDVPEFRPTALARTADTIVLAGTGFGSAEVRALDAATGRTLPFRLAARGPFSGFAMAEGDPEAVYLGGNLWQLGTQLSTCLAVLRPPRAGAPQRMSATVTGATVGLGWQPGPSNAGATFVVEAGTSAGASDVGVFDVGSATRVTGTMPAGTLYARVRGVSGGRAGAASSEVILTIPSTSTPPNAPGTLSASIAAGAVTLTWSAASGNATTYVIEAGTASGLSNIGTLPTAHLDTTLTTSAPAGTYYVRVRAANAFGQSAPSNEVAVMVP